MFNIFDDLLENIPTLKRCDFFDSEGNLTNFGTFIVVFYALAISKKFFDIYFDLMRFGYGKTRK